MHAAIRHNEERDLTVNFFTVVCHDVEVGISGVSRICNIGGCWRSAGGRLTQRDESTLTSLQALN